MRTFPSGFADEMAKKTGAAPVWILHCPWPSTGTVYLSDREFTVENWSGHGSPEMLPIVAEWGQVDEDIAGDIAMPTVSDFSLTALVDHDASTTSTNIKDMLWDTDNLLEVTDCTLYLWFLGLDAATDPPQPVWAGNVTDFEQQGEDLFTVSMTDQSVRLNKQLGRKLAVEMAGTSGIPDPDDVGKTIPLVYGAIAKSPALAVEAGWGTTLAEDMSETQTAISLTSEHPNLAYYVVQIGDEQVQVRPSGCVRGLNGTEAESHSAGANVFEVITEYVYLAADHPVKAINAVYVKNPTTDAIVKQIGNWTVYTGQPGSEHPRYPGQAVVKFTAKPVVSLQSTVELTDEMQVDDDIEVSAVASSMTIYPLQEDNATDGNSATYEFREPDDPDVVAHYPDAYNNAGEIYRQVIEVKTDWAYCGGAVPEFEDGGTEYLQNSNGTLPYGSNRVWKYGGRWDESLTIRVQGDPGYTPGGGVWIFEIGPKTVEYFPALQKTGSAYRQGNIYLTGNSSADVTVGGQVLVDIEGWQDDASGTITGTPYALIEHPEHIVRHMVSQYCTWNVNAFNLPDAEAPESFAVRIGESKTLKAWLASIAFQAGYSLRWASGLIIMLYRPAVNIVATITTAMIKHGDDNAMSMKISRAPLDQMLNNISLRYGRDWSKEGDEAYALFAELSNEISIARYGEKQREDLEAWDFIGDTPGVIPGWYLGYYGIRERIAEIDLHLDNAALEYGDYVLIPFLGSYPWELTKVNVAPGSIESVDLIRITARERSSV